MKEHQQNINSGNSELSDVNTKGLELLYSAILGEINRYRDWPIRIVTSTSVFYIGLIGLVMVYKVHIDSLTVKKVITAIILLFAACTMTVFIKIHRNYLKARNVQAEIQKYWNLGDIKLNQKSVVPSEWLTGRGVSIFSGFWGWGYYALLVIILALLTILVIWFGPEIGRNICHQGFIIRGFLGVIT